MSANDIVFTFWNETWADAVQRKFMPPDRLVQALLSSSRVRGLLVANPYRSAPRFVARKMLRLPAPAFPRRPTFDLTTPLRVWRNESIGESALRATYASYDAHLRTRADQLGLSRPAMITTNPFYAAFAPLDWTSSVTYYAWDDWAALASLKRWWPDIERAYRTMADRGTRVCAVSENLLARIGPSGPGAVVPNGIMPSEWQPPWTAPSWFAALPKPRLIYVGSIHERLNTETFREISESFPNASIVVVGPVSNQQVVKDLEKLKNVHIHHALPHAEVAGLIHSADVCLMPHHRNKLTESMSPLKVYEYCATGRPVVATDLPPVRNVQERVHLVAEGASFSEAIKQALNDGPMAEDDRQAFLQRNSWQGRHEAILDLALR